MNPDNTRQMGEDCDVCGLTHWHTVLQYRFEDSSLGLDQSVSQDCVTVVTDEFGDWTVEVDDGYVITDKRWDSESNEIIVEVVREMGESE